MHCLQSENEINIYEKLAAMIECEICKEDIIMHDIKT